jgi:2-polyprenyl-6-methoxyphenol hydroxylase-like FAD-dependent oxidoreductase
MEKIGHALIIGAGIAGCSAAITLAKQGTKVTLIEKQAVWRFPNSGIFIYSNGLAAFHKLGVLQEILKAGFAIDDGKSTYLDPQGVPIVDVFYPSVGENMPPILGIKRTEIHRVLAEKIHSLGVDVRLATTTVNIDTECGAHNVEVTFSDGVIGRFDLVIGADGIRSHTRQLIFGSVKPSYTGFGIWRSVHERPLSLSKKIMMMGVGKRLGIVPISKDKVYLFGVIAEPLGRRHTQEKLPSQMRGRFSEFGGLAMQFLQQLSIGSEVIYTAVEEISVSLPWHKGRVILIGDAAHACAPFMGQGGTMAIEDAVILAEMLSEKDGVEDILHAFEERRFPICKFVQDISRKVGEAGALEDHDTCASRNFALQRLAQQHINNFYRELQALSSAHNR